MGHQPDKKQQVRFEVVDASSDGQRIDNFLVKHLKGVPKSHLYKLMRTGQLRVNGKRVKPGHKLTLNDQVRIPPIRAGTSRAVSVPDRLIEVLTGRVLFENERLLVIDKPAGLSVHRGSGVDFGVIDVLKVLRDEAKNWSLVHRLDRDTSGCLIVAKDRRALLEAQSLFKNGAVTKHYVALTAGCWPLDSQTVDLPLRKNQLQGGERMVFVDETGKPARSHFEVVRRYRNATLVRVAIETGRTHQIRVHAQHIGYPLAADSRYGDKAFNSHVRRLGLKRLFLHAHRLQFTLGTAIDIQSPLPPDLEQFLATLKS